MREPEPQQARKGYGVLVLLVSVASENFKKQPGVKCRMSLSVALSRYLSHQEV